MHYNAKAHIRSSQLCNKQDLQGLILTAALHHWLLCCLGVLITEVNSIISLTSNPLWNFTVFYLFFIYFNPLFSQICKYGKQSLIKMQTLKITVPDISHLVKDREVSRLLDYYYRIFPSSIIKLFVLYLTKKLPFLSYYQLVLLLQCYFM